MHISKFIFFNPFVCRSGSKYVPTVGSRWVITDNFLSLLICFNNPLAWVWRNPFVGLERVWQRAVRLCARGPHPPRGDRHQDWSHRGQWIRSYFFRIRIRLFFRKFQIRGSCFRIRPNFSVRRQKQKKSANFNFKEAIFKAYLPTCEIVCP